MDMISSIQTKTEHNGIVSLTTYYYYLENSIIKIYNTTIEYLYPTKLESIQLPGEFEIVNYDDYESENTLWYGRTLITSIKNSLYIPRIDYSAKELENIGYAPLLYNNYFGQSIWNCLIYSDNRKYDLLLEFINIWKLKKINIHYISGSFENNEYDLFAKFSEDLTINTNVTFHTTYLDKFDKQSFIDFIKNYKTEFKFSKKHSDTINITILNNPEFDVDSEIYTEISGDKKNIIIFDKNISNFNRFIDYVCLPSSMITKFGESINTQYPLINNSEDMYAIYSHSDCDSLARQLNYIRL
jgi:hypothetical protein